MSSVVEASSLHAFSSGVGSVSDEKQSFEEGRSQAGAFEVALFGVSKLGVPQE